MTTTAAQDEFNELMRDKDIDSRHPEDRHNDSDNVSEPESNNADDYREKVDTDDELDIPKTNNMHSTANYQLPSLRSEANTGPKGVIADARAFEQAKKQARRFTWKKSSPEPQYSVKVWHDDKADSDEEEDSFMKEWRAARLKELQNVGQRIRSRTNSPSRRIYGNFPLVDGEAYLDAIEKSGPETVVVVFIFSSTTDDEDSLKFTAKARQCMHEVAKRNDTTRFVQLDNTTAEVGDVGLPAVVAYKHEKMIANLTPLRRELSIDNELTVVSLETIFRQNRIL